MTVIPGVYPNCQNHGTCYAQAMRLINTEKEVKEKDEKIVVLNERLDETLARIHVGATPGELKRDAETFKRLQDTERVQRNCVDRLEEENARLRQVLRTNGYDMDAVQAIMDSIKPPKEIE